MKKKTISRLSRIPADVPRWSACKDQLEYSLCQGIEEFRRNSGIALTKSQFLAYVFSCGRMSTVEFVLHMGKMGKKKKKIGRDNVAKLKKDMDALAKKNKALGHEVEKAKSRKKVKTLLKRITAQ